MIVEIIALGLIAGIFWRRYDSVAPTTDEQISENKVKKYFASAHDQWPIGARDIMIDGAGITNIFAQGNPEPRNPMNQLFTYPQARVSSEINKNNERWQQVGILRKDKQLDFIEEKIAMYDHILLTAPYKQADGKTKSAQPKVNLKRYSAAQGSTFGSDMSREGPARLSNGHYA